MAHFAEIDANGTVRRVVVVSNAELQDEGQESEAKGVAFLQSLYGQGTWVQTSYNANRRKHYAGPGYTYDAQRDAFIPPKPYQSWLLDEEACTWIAPVPKPEGPHAWDEQSQQWVSA